MPWYSPQGMGQISNMPEFLRTHWWVSAKDALIVVALYALTATVLRNWYWGRHFNGRRLGILLPLAFVWATALEYYHVHIAHSWAYLPIMPLIPLLDIGLWPILQMLVIPPTAIWLTRKNLLH